MIPFTTDVFFRLVAGYNAAIWPLQIVAWAWGLLALGLAARPVANGDRAVTALLGAAWIWTGVVFHMMHFAAINWAALAFGPLFALQGALLLAHALPGRLRFRLPRGPGHGMASWAGLAFALYAIAGHPLVELLLGRPWAELRPFILAPAPLTLFTLGLLLMAEAPAPRHLFAIPFLWSLVAGAGAWSLGALQDLVVPAAGVLSVCLALARRSRPAHPA